MFILPTSAISPIPFSIYASTSESSKGIYPIPSMSSNVISSLSKLILLLEIFSLVIVPSNISKVPISPSNICFPVITPFRISSDFISESVNLIKI